MFTKLAESFDVSGLEKRRTGSNKIKGDLIA